MLEKIEQNCLNCGAPLRRGASRCEYCGTMYKSDGNDAPLCSSDYICGTKTLYCSARIDNEMLLKCQDKAMEYVKRNLSHALAKQIIDCIDLSTTEDLRSFSKIIQGRVTIVDRR